MSGGLSLTQAVRRAVVIKRNETAVIDGPAQFTWEQFADRVSRLAAGFLALGLKPGGRIVLLALNSHRSLECFYAAMQAGGVIVPLNHRLGMCEILAQADDCAPQIVVLDPEFAAMREALLVATDGSTRSMIYCSSDAAPPGFHSYEELLVSHLPIDDAGRHGDDLACLLYTSGTTSAAKGVMLSHANFCVNTANVVAELSMDEGTVHLHHGPLFHVASAARLFSTTHVAGTHVFLPRFVAGEVISEIARARVTHATFVPTMFRMILDDPTLKRADLTSLRCVSYGSAAMPEPLLREFMSALPSVRMLQSYGMTELSPVVTILGWRDHLPEASSSGRLRSAGRAVMLAEVAIVDEEGRQLPAGRHGEILARGPMVMQGYWNRPDLTAEALRGGWMHTGDLGYLDEDGYLFVVDRLKDMIITGGENVWSQEVENALSSHPAVSLCAIIGKPDPIWGETVHGVVNLRDNMIVTEAELIAHCRSLIAHYKCPRSINIRNEPLPLSGANKVLKSELRDEVS